MKIVKDDAVYVQKKDIYFLNQTGYVVPNSIYIKLGVDVVNNSFEFVKFDGKDEIEFFKNIDFIIDYDSIKDLDEDDIIRKVISVAQEKNNVAQFLASIPISQYIKNMHMIDECERLDFKIDSLRDVLWYKQGYIEMEFPEECCCDLKKCEKQKKKYRE